MSATRDDTTRRAATGPLADVRVVEISGIGPAPYSSMLLAEAGADVIRIDRPSPKSVGGTSGPFVDLLTRSRPLLHVDLKDPDGVELVLELVEAADALIEGFRPGTMERLGLGPDECFARNTRLVYGRMTGWGQEGPLSDTAGHDLNYTALAGSLWPIGRAGDVPVPPLNLVGDFGGGGMMLAFGVCAALLEARRSGNGQVVDAAMIDGAASLTTFIHGLRRGGGWIDQRGMNLLDSGAHFYEVYEAADGGYVAVGAIEPQFYAALLDGLGLDGESLPDQMDRAKWPEMKAFFAKVFATRDRDEWAAIFQGSDACVVPVLSFDEAPRHPHNRARRTFLEIEGTVQPGAAPRFSRTPASVRRPPGEPVSDDHLAAWGIGRDRLRRLWQEGVLR